MESMDTFRYVHPRIVGTFVTVTLYSSPGELDDDGADEIDDAITNEFERLEHIFSVYRPDSELERWKRGELAPGETSAEFRHTMSEALGWQHRSSGAFHTASGLVTDLWRASAERGTPPSDDERAAVLALLQHDPFSIGPNGEPVPRDGVHWVNLNAFAKGSIVDRVAKLAITDRRLAGLIISAGGDLCHRGVEPVIVAVENPLRPYDNEPPLTRISVLDQAVATSGRARKGFQIGDRFYSHVIDPRTALTVDGVASITVVADDAATADVLATVIGLADPDDAVDVADGYGVAMLMVLPDGTQLSNRAFSELVSTS